jgi:ethanolamine ammonia-lyase large subunit
MSAYKKYYDGLYANKVEGSKMLSMVQLRLDKDTITNIILSNAQKTVNGGITGIMEVKDWNSDGSMETKGRVKLKTLQNELSKEDVQPLLYVPGTAATRGVIVKLGKKTYLIPQNVLGSIGAEAFNIDVPMLQTAYQTKQDLISRYGEDAYYKSPEGQKLEATID